MRSSPCGQIREKAAASWRSGPKLPRRGWILPRSLWRGDGVRLRRCARRPSVEAPPLSMVAVGTRISPRPPHIYGPAARCKRINRMGHAVRFNLSDLWLEHALRAIMEIRAQLSSLDPRPRGPRAGPDFSLRRGDRCSIVLTFSREPRQGSSRFTSGSQPQPSCRFWRRCGTVSASMIEYRPRDARELVGQRYGKDVFM